MVALEQLYAALPRFLPVLIVLVIAGVGLWLADAILRQRAERRGSGRFTRQIAMLALTAGVIVVAVLALPGSEETRGQLLGLLGLVLTAIIALSSTTFVANAMGGLMLRSVGSFRPGDFVRVGDQFGRVTERGLFHTEIQTEDRDLATLPNLYLVSNPMIVVRSSGTIISCSVSLGYETHHAHVEALLIEAARAAELEEPFVQILELGNFSVTYRIAGFLADVKRLITSRSSLRAHVLDTLHRAGVEIVSPTFMVQRPQLAGSRVLAPTSAAEAPAAERSAAAPEDLIFDKAEEAASLEELRGERERLLAEIAALEDRVGSVEAGERARVEREVELRRLRVANLEKRLAVAETSSKGAPNGERA